MGRSVSNSRREPHQPKNPSKRASVSLLLARHILKLLRRLTRNPGRALGQGACDFVLHTSPPQNQKIKIMRKKAAIILLLVALCYILGLVTPSYCPGSADVGA